MVSTSWSSFPFLALYVLMLMANHPVGAWVSSSVTKSASIASSSRTPPLYLDPSSVMDFIQGVDSALGNPTTSSDAVSMMGAIKSAGQAATDATDVASSSSKTVEMAISDTTILIGGALATLAIGGTAVVSQMIDKADDDEIPTPNLSNEKISALERAVTQKASEVAVKSSQTEQSEVASDDWSDDVKTPVDQDEAGKTNDKDTVKSTSSASGDKDESEPQAMESKQPVQEEEIEKKDKSKKVSEETVAIVDEAENAISDLFSVAESEEANNDFPVQEMLDHEKWLRKEMENQLEQTLKELQEMETELKAEIAGLVRTNQELEDKYEMEQNENKARNAQIEVLQAELQTSQRQTATTQQVLTEAQEKLVSIQATLKATIEALEEVQSDNQSLRKLSSKMLAVSKERVRKRFQKIRNRFRRNKQ